jgi:hypothetical protein
MAIITLRQANVFNSPNATVKGSPLTNSEVDNNFANINIEVASLSNVISVSTGNINVGGNIIPLTSNTFDLGAPDKIFRDLYLSGNSLFVGNLRLSVVSGNIALDGNVVLSPTGGATPADGTITAAKIDSDAVTTAKIAANAITTAKIAEGNVTAASLATNSVTEDKINTGAVTEAKIGSGAVTEAKLSAITGSGNVVLQTSPVLLTPNVGTATAQGVILSDGAVGTPAIRFSDDTNTGIFRDGADNLVFSTGGVARANINSGGFFEANFKDKVIALGNSGTSKTIDLSLGTSFTTTLTGNCTFTISNAQIGSSFVLQVTNDATPGRSIALAGGTNFRFPFGSEGRSTAANAIDVWYFTTFDGGTNWIVAIPVKSAATL